MKKLTLLALSFAAGVSLSHAQLVPNAGFAYDDLLLGFVQTTGQGSTNNLVIDLGSYGAFLNTPATTNTPTNFGNWITNAYGSIAQVYGSGWATNSTLSWGIVAYNGTGVTTNGDVNRSFYMSQDTNLATPIRVNSASAATIGGNIALVGGQYITDLGNSQVTTGGTGNGNGVIQLTSESGSWSSQYASTFGVSWDQMTSVTNNLNLYKFTPTAAANQPATLLGTYSLASVPEPSTYMLFGFGVVVALFAIRRRKLQS